MDNNQIVYLRYIEEFNSYGIAKDEIIKLQRDNLVAEIILPPDISATNDENMPLIGFLLGEDTSKDGKAYGEPKLSSIFAKHQSQVAFFRLRTP